MARPRVLYICFDTVPSPKGASTHITAFVEALARQYDVTLLSPGTSASTGTYAGARHQVVAADQPNYLDRALAYREMVWDILEDGDYDIVHFRTMWAALPVAHERPRSGYRVVCEVNAVESIELKYHYPALGSRPELLARLRAQEELAFTTADALVTPSAVTARHLARRGAAAEKITVIPNGVDTERFAPPSPRPAPSPTPTVLYLGTLAPWQGIDLLLDGVRRAVTQRPMRLRLLCPHTSRWMHPVTKMIRKWGLTEHVEILPPVPHADVPAVISGADICVAPLTPTERNLVQGCCPVKLFEYMACGTAILASDLPVVHQVLTHEVTGLLFKASKASRLAEGLLRLVDDAPLRAALGANARREVEARFTWASAQEKLLALYAGPGMSGTPLPADPALPPA